MSTLETSRSQLAESADHPAMWPFISVVMPIRNEARSIAHTLEDLLRQSYARDRFEIIVVDGESSDDTRDIVQGFIQSHGHVQLLMNPRRWSSAARNIGIRAARGELILIVDGHCEIRTANYLQELASAFRARGRIAWAGRNRWRFCNRALCSERSARVRFTTRAPSRFARVRDNRAGGAGAQRSRRLPPIGF